MVHFYTVVVRFKQTVNSSLCLCAKKDKISLRTKADAYMHFEFGISWLYIHYIKGVTCMCHNLRNERVMDYISIGWEVA